MVNSPVAMKSRGRQKNRNRREIVNLEDGSEKPFAVYLWVQGQRQFVGRYRSARTAKTTASRAQTLALRRQEKMPGEFVTYCPDGLWLSEADSESEFYPAPEYSGPQKLAASLIERTILDLDARDVSLRTEARNWFERTKEEDLEIWKRDPSVLTLARACDWLGLDRDLVVAQYQQREKDISWKLQMERRRHG